MPPLPDVDLDLCAREAIRTPGAIQPHGALLSLDAATLDVRQRSANAAAFLGGLLDGVRPSGVLAEMLAAWRDGDQPALVDRIEHGAATSMSRATVWPTGWSWSSSPASAPRRSRRSTRASGPASNAWRRRKTSTP